MAFQKKQWQFNDIITEGELNRMEDGIEEGITKAEQAEQTAQQAAQTADQASQTASQTASALAAHEADNTIHVSQQEKNKWDNIRVDHTKEIRVEVVSSSESETPEAGRIIFDTSQGKFFGGNGSGWV